MIITAYFIPGIMIGIEYNWEESKLVFDLLIVRVVISKDGVY